MGGPKTAIFTQVVHLYPDAVGHITIGGNKLKRDLLEILDDRYDKKSTVSTSQLPIEQWHEYLSEPTLADAILDRLVHNAYRLTLKGESMRKQRAVRRAEQPSDT